MLCCGIFTARIQNEFSKILKTFSQHLMANLILVSWTIWHWNSLRLVGDLSSKILPEFLWLAFIMPWATKEQRKDWKFPKYWPFVKKMIETLLLCQKRHNPNDIIYPLLFLGLCWAASKLLHAHINLINLKIFEMG